jgi:GNAT superfamily N-acetyltransferase
MGRVIGDGALAYYIQDIIVLPAFQKQGVGRLIMDDIIRHLKKNCTPNSIVGLMAAKGVTAFYEKYGFIARPDEKHGPGMFIRWS